MTAIQLFFKGPQYKSIPWYYNGNGLSSEPVWFDNELDVGYLLTKINKNTFIVKLIAK